MIMEIFTALTEALQKSPWVALGASFLWGILSIVLSPCHLSSIPLIVGFMSGQTKISFKKAFLTSLLFSLGILITIGLVGIITSLLGRMLGDIGMWGNLFVAIIFFVVGLYLIGVVPLPFLNQLGQPQFRKRGYFAAFLLGLIFGIAVGPCTFAYMAPMLGIVFNVASTQFAYAVMLIVAYALGHCSIIVFAGSSFEVIEKYLRWNEKSDTLSIIKKICGILVLAGGVYLVYGAVRVLF